MGSNEFAMLGFMLTTEIQQDTHTGPVTLDPRWLRIPSAVKYSGLSQSRIYELLGQWQVKSICLKSENSALRRSFRGQGVD
jgi:predicted DNA-binding transcriptional regulator AlpA